MASCRSTWSTQRQSVTLPLDLLNNGQPPPSVTVDQQDITRRRSDTSQTGSTTVQLYRFTDKDELQEDNRI